MAKFSFSKDLQQMIAAPGQRKRFPHLQKIADDAREALKEASKAGETAMKDRVLNSPPTGTKADDGQRVDTFTMFESINRSRVQAARQNDRRRRGSLSVSFGFPADENGNIKDAPLTPINPPKNANWRSDPNYFVMQEYGDSMFDEAFYPGMFSQDAGMEAAKTAFDMHMKKKGYK